jgi:hypothetical protein
MRSPLPGIGVTAGSTAAMAAASAANTTARIDRPTQFS